MGRAQDKLAAALGTAGRITQGTLAIPRLGDLLRTSYCAAYESAYLELGGIMGEAPFRPGKWDVEFEGIAVELDEQLHFNRYRATTLSSRIYRALPAFPHRLYLEYCRDHEAECLKAGSYGGRWSNSSCERQFGPAGVPGQIDGSGAPRWKQRALYDLAKDMAPLLLGIRVARVSIYDLVTDESRQVLVSDALERPSRASLESLVTLIRERALVD